ncbi:uncharacterized protein LOC127801289 [Diospyros lotus]|uniref:uncharacterized protein LOC127801289 n=1 Tax=Diospyros lotus TaxID=55363 RepID=UPI002258785B|nr:uncharacterized protein LOC127801289 [Diospyros lotus]
MGNCRSSDSEPVRTAKLVIFPDGALQEFSSPVKVADVLRWNPECFVCNSDEMEFEEPVSAVGVDEELQAGQLYFVLPLSWLAQPLQAADMAALAVRASQALTAGGGGQKCGCFCRRVDSLVVFEEKDAQSGRRLVAAGGRGAGGKPVSWPEI